MSDEAGVESTAEAKIGLIRLALVVTGGGCITTGAWMAYPPAGWIVGGLLLFSVGMIGALRA